MASDWLAVVPPANQMPSVKIFVNYHRFYHANFLVTQALAGLIVCFQVLVHQIPLWFLSSVCVERITIRTVAAFKCLLGAHHTPLFDDVINWKHLPRYRPSVRGIHRSPVIFPHKGQWRVALMFSLICAWISRWVNNGEAADLGHHRAHYGVTVMFMIGGHLLIYDWWLISSFYQC